MINFGTEVLESGILLVRVGGNLDTESSQYFFDCMSDELKNGHTKVVLNCGDLGFVSSIGLSTLIRIRTRLTKMGGQVHLAEVQSTISDLLHLVNFDKLFQLFPTEQDAIAAMK